MTHFIISQPVSIEETRHCEFKEITGKNPVNTIKNTCDEYVVAFLNSGGGRIYWGIRDSDRVVVGVRLTYKDRDKLRKVITNQLSNIRPAISPNAYRVNLHPVLDDNQEPIEDCYVVEIVVPKPLSNDLHYTGSNEVFLKTDSGKKKLSIAEIQDEILRRKLTPESHVQPVEQQLDVPNARSIFQLQLRYDRNGALLYDGLELHALASEAIFAVENSVAINPIIELDEIKLIENALRGLESDKITPQERIMKVELLRQLKLLEKQRKRLEQALDVIFTEPVFSYCKHNHYIACVFQGLGKRLLGRSSWSGNDIFVPLDLWYRENKRIHAVVVIELDSEEEREPYEKLIGSGWDLYDLPGDAMFEYGVPAIVLEYLRLREEQRFENLDEILNISMWNVGLR